MAKNKKDQELRTSGIISMFFLIAACIMILAPAWSSGRGSDQEQAMRRAESLAYQLIESQKPSRAPASALESTLNHLIAEEGKIGLDPWGHAYHFKVMKIQNGIQAKVLVWSEGPDKVRQTTTEILDSNRDKESPQFEGDDLGVMVVIK